MTEIRRNGIDRRTQNTAVTVEQRSGLDRRDALVRTRQYIAILQKIPIFKGLSVDQYKKILSIATHVIYHDGEQLCRTGDESHELYIIIKGQLLVTSPDGKEISRIDPIGIVGEMGIFTNDLHTVTVSSAAESIIILIRKAELMVLLRRDNDLAIHTLLNVIRSLADKLRDDNEIIEDLRQIQHEEPPPEQHDEES
ncbi:cyclic nucleotide-binding domain-containing protein [bacterium]|nr:cyclic nucleotide-binding domain-containing protein [bacterium]